ncbi:MAG: hypothetical protein JXB39_11045 [Deltaproteobacteria bacterium]|nr:hypothetical protein [Deltaproteobacteria bacterium]
MRQDLDTLLFRVKADDLSVRLGEVVLQVLPDAPVLPRWRSIEEAVRAVEPAAGPEVVARARALAERPGPQAALRLMDDLEAGGALKALFTAIRARLFQRSGGVLGGTIEDRQGRDAACKLVVLAALCDVLLDGEPADLVPALEDHAAGRALLAWFGAVEIALPFADDPIPGLVSRLVERFGAEGVRTVDAALGAGAGVRAAARVPHLSVGVEAAARRALGRLDTLGGALLSRVPGAKRLIDVAGDVAAEGIDTVPIYRVLVPAFVAEVCARRALAGVNPSAEPPTVPTGRVEPPRVVPRPPQPPVVPPRVMVPEPSTVPTGRVEPPPVPEEPPTVPTGRVEPPRVVPRPPQPPRVVPPQPPVVPPRVGAAVVAPRPVVAAVAALPRKRRGMRTFVLLVFVLLVLGCSGVLLAGGFVVFGPVIAERAGYRINLPHFLR